MRSVIVSYVYAKRDGNELIGKAFWTGQVDGTSDEQIKAAIETARPQQQIVKIYTIEILH